MFDVLVVGGGAIGSSVAYHLKSDPNFTGSVVVIERDPTYARASSALSASSIRQQFSTPLNIHLSRYGIGFLRRAHELLGVDLGLKEPGYLFLASDGGRGRAARQSRHPEGRGLFGRAARSGGAPRGAFPGSPTEGVALASHGTANEGWFDGPALMQAFRRKARERGAEYIADEVVELAPNAVTLRSGGTIEAAHHRAGGRPVVGRGGRTRRHCAAGRAAPPLGVRVRCAANAPGPTPLIIDPSGTWFRPEGRFYIGGTTPAAGNDPPGAPLEVQHQEWDDMVWPTLAARVPAFEAAKVVNSWAGYYEYNTFDQNGIVGRHPGDRQPDLRHRLLAATASSSRPAVGRAVAELIVHGSYRTLDLSPFGYERISAGRPIRELNVV